LSISDDDECDECEESMGSSLDFDDSSIELEACRIKQEECKLEVEEKVQEFARKSSRADSGIRKKKEKKDKKEKSKEKESSTRSKRARRSSVEDSPSSIAVVSAPAPVAAVFGQDALIALMMAQSFDGSFNDSAASLLTGLTAAQITSSLPSGVDAKVWLTLVVLAFLEHKASADRDQWEMNFRKAQKWIKSKTSDFVSLQQQAKTFVTSLVN